MTQERPESQPVDPAPGPPRASRDANEAWSILSYLISGMAFWGFVGWALVRWTGWTLLFPVFLIFGILVAFYLIWIRYLREPRQ